VSLPSCYGCATGTHSCDGPLCPCAEAGHPGRAKAKADVAIPPDAWMTVTKLGIMVRHDEDHTVRVRIEEL
jgi:hypothetical protein